jgi:hypothetical protein
MLAFRFSKVQEVQHFTVDHVRVPLASARAYVVSLQDQARRPIARAGGDHGWYRVLASFVLQPAFNRIDGVGAVPETLLLDQVQRSTICGAEPTKLALTACETRR